MTKSYGNAAPTGAMGLYVVFGSGLGSILNNEYSYFRKANLSANLKGLYLGQAAANGFYKFSDFVMDFCKNEIICKGQ